MDTNRTLTFLIIFNKSRTDVILAGAPARKLCRDRVSRKYTLRGIFISPDLKASDPSVSNETHTHTRSYFNRKQNLFYCKWSNVFSTKSYKKQDFPIEWTCRRQSSRFRCSVVPSAPVAAVVWVIVSVWSVWVAIVVARIVTVWSVRITVSVSIRWGSGEILFTVWLRCRIDQWCKLIDRRHSSWLRNTNRNRTDECNGTSNDQHNLKAMRYYQFYQIENTSPHRCTHKSQRCHFMWIFFLAVSLNSADFLFCYFVLWTNKRQLTNNLKHRRVFIPASFDSRHKS